VSVVFERNRSKLVLDGQFCVSKPIAKQISRLRELFPELGTADVERANRPLPPNAAGWFAIPRSERVGRTYSEAVEMVLALLSRTRRGKFRNGRNADFGPNHFRQHERTVTMLKKLGEQQPGHDILVVPAQFGARYQDRPVCEVRKLLVPNEFGLGAFEVGCMLLVHPRRLQRRRDLWIDCPGDEHDDPNEEERFSDAPGFLFIDGELKFTAGWCGYYSENWGSATGFVA